MTARERTSGALGTGGGGLGGEAQTSCMGVSAVTVSDATWMKLLVDAAKPMKKEGGMTTGWLPKTVTPLMNQDSTPAPGAPPVVGMKSTCANTVLPVSATPASDAPPVVLVQEPPNMRLEDAYTSWLLISM